MGVDIWWTNYNIIDIRLLKEYLPPMQQKPKSIRAIRQLRKKQPKMIEGIKNTLFMRGNKSSTPVMSLMKDLRSLRRVHSVFYSRKHESLPFENKDQLQKLCKKADSSLFFFGSHNKKRPNNIIIGRTYEHKVLDMVELGIMNVTSIADIVASAEIPYNFQPFLVFQGDLWESDAEIKKIKNLINDFFFMNNKIREIEIDKALKVVICWSVTEDRRIYLNTFQVDIQGGVDILAEQGKLVIEQLGPNAEFCLRRKQLASQQDFKKATHVPKPKKKKQNKNIKYDNLGNKRGKLYMQRQNLKSLPFKRRKIISKKDKNQGQIIAHPKNEDQFGQ